jgi:hypothetical protein
MGQYDDVPLIIWALLEFPACTNPELNSHRDIFDPSNFSTPERVTRPTK